jgi:very-short-patch-repair endonuclease
LTDKVLKILNSVCEGWLQEFRFNSVRKFKFDYANLKKKIAVELEGGIYQGTGHAKVRRYLSDMEKYNDAMLRGWVVLRYAHGQEKLIADDIKRALKLRSNEKEKKIDNNKKIDNKKIDDVDKP